MTHLWCSRFKSLPWIILLLLSLTHCNRLAVTPPPSPEIPIESQVGQLSANKTALAGGETTDIRVAVVKVLGAEDPFEYQWTTTGGVILAGHVHKGYGSVVVTFRNSPAELAGLKPHDRVLAVDGLSLLGADGRLHTDMLRGAAGTPLTLTIQTPGEEQREVQLVRAQIRGAVPIDYWLVPGTRIAYILIVITLAEVALAGLVMAIYWAEQLR